MKSKIFIPTEYGWVSPDTPPVNHNSVVVLAWSEYEEMYFELIGYYEVGQWELCGISEVTNEPDPVFCVVGWFPCPYSPDNH